MGAVHWEMMLARDGMAYFWPSASRQYIMGQCCMGAETFGNFKHYSRAPASSCFLHMDIIVRKLFVLSQRRKHEGGLHLGRMCQQTNQLSCAGRSAAIGASTHMLYSFTMMTCLCWNPYASQTFMARGKMQILPNYRSSWFITDKIKGLP